MPGKAKNKKKISPEMFMVGRMVMSPHIRYGDTLRCIGSSAHQVARQADRKTLYILSGVY